MFKKVALTIGCVVLILGPAQAKLLSPVMVASYNQKFTPRPTPTPVDPDAAQRGGPVDGPTDGPLDGPPDGPPVAKHAIGGPNMAESDVVVTPAPLTGYGPPPTPLPTPSSPEFNTLLSSLRSARVGSRVALPAHMVVCDADGTCSHWNIGGRFGRGERLARPGMMGFGLSASALSLEVLQSTSNSLAVSVRDQSGVRSIYQGRRNGDEFKGELVREVGAQTGRAPWNGARSGIIANVPRAMILCPRGGCQKNGDTTMAMLRVEGTDADGVFYWHGSRMSNGQDGASDLDVDIARFDEHSVVMILTSVAGVNIGERYFLDMHRISSTHMEGKSIDYQGSSDPVQVSTIKGGIVQGNQVATLIANEKQLYSQVRYNQRMAMMHAAFFGAALFSDALDEVDDY